MRFLLIRETGAAVRWLPIGLGEQDDGVAIHLPCPATDLFRLACVCSDRDPAASLNRLLRLNPTLMLFALSNYQQDLHSPPNSARKLVAWGQTNLIHAMGRTEIICGPDLFDECSENRFNSEFKDYLRARSNRKLRRSLQRFLRLFCDVGKSTAKANVVRLVGKKLRVEQFKCKQVRRKKTYTLATSRWLNRVGEDIDVGSLFDLARSSIETAAGFAARLQEEKLASMKQLAYGASHEINNPLANIATRAQTMLAHETDCEKRHKLAVIYEQAMRAHEMISDMMLFAHPPALKRERLSVRLLLARIVHELKPVFETVPEIELKVLFGAGVDQAQLDRTQISVAIKNLVQNSIEALCSSDQRNQQIKVRIERTKSEDLQISIWDNGAGISDAVARHMFDPFYSGREAGRGLGFGLSKVWTIAKLHGGEFRHEHNHDDGTRFVLTLPGNLEKTHDCPASTLTICRNRPNVEEEAA